MPLSLQFKQLRHVTKPKEAMCFSNNLCKSVFLLFPARIAIFTYTTIVKVAPKMPRVSLLYTRNHITIQYPTGTKINSWRGCISIIPPVQSMPILISLFSMPIRLAQTALVNPRPRLSCRPAHVYLMVKDIIYKWPKSWHGTITDDQLVNSQLTRLIILSKFDSSNNLSCNFQGFMKFNIDQLLKQEFPKT